jgi:hypothetical protein
VGLTGTSMSARREMMTMRVRDSKQQELKLEQNEALGVAWRWTHTRRRGRAAPERQRGHTWSGNENQEDVGKGRRLADDQNIMERKRSAREWLRPRTSGIQGTRSRAWRDREAAVGARKSMSSLDDAMARCLVMREQTLALLATMSASSRAA